MKVILGSGIYHPVRALILQDRKSEFLDTLQDYAFYKALNLSAMDEKFKQSIEECNPEEVKMTVSPMSEDRDYCCPGYVYLEATLNSLRSLPASTTLMIELDDNRNHRICLLYKLRAVGYGVDIPDDLSPEAADAFLDTTIRHLILMPGILRPEEPDIPEYITAYQESACRYVAYLKPLSTESPVEICGN